MLYFIDNYYKMVKIKEELLNKTLYIPLEIIDREIDGGCLLAMEAVARGWKVIIGSQRTITKNIETNEIGIYFLKSITPGQINLQKRIANSGSLIFTQDAEGLLQRPGMEYKMRFSKESIEIAKKIFFWGEKQKKDFLQVFGSKYESKCIVTGSPRADHWELTSRSTKLKANPKYILIATSFGNENHALGDSGQYNLAKEEAGIKYGANSLEEFNKYFNDTYQLGTFLIPHYKKLLVDLSKSFPREEIILRPHPSESLEMWLNITSSLHNVSLRNDGSIVDWLNKSKVLIQYGSTCAIQANILEVPVVSLIPDLPKNIESYDLEDSRNASCVYKNTNQLVEDFKKFLKGELSLYPSSKDYIDKLILSRKTVDSSKRIMRVIDNIYEKTKTVKVTSNKGGLKFKFKINQIKQYIVLFFSLFPYWQKLGPKKYRHLSLKTFLYYKKRKQPYQSITEFENRIEYLKKLSSFKKDIKIKSFKKDVFEMM